MNRQFPYAQPERLSPDERQARAVARARETRARADARALAALVPFAATAAPARASTREGPVSKTDALRYYRCPYGSWLLDMGIVVFEEVADVGLCERLDDGFTFEELVRADMAAMPASMSWRDYLDQDVEIHDTPMFRNRERGLIGRPDGIWTGFGAVAPIEIKSHRAIQSSDRIELAFYWRLLEPQRTRDVEPYGLLILRDGMTESRHRIVLTDDDFRTVDRLIDGVRAARRDGVAPRWCRCIVCASRPEILALEEDGEDLGLLFDLGYRRSVALEHAGVPTISALLAQDPIALAEQLRSTRLGISASRILRWQHHATAFREARTVFFGEQRFTQRDFLVLDLEYGAREVDIWLTGIGIVRNAELVDVKQFWSHDRKQLRGALTQLEEVLRDNPSLPVVTWSGAKADLPTLKQACGALRRRRVLSMILERHVDMYELLTRSARPPLTSYALDAVADYLGYRYETRIRSGLEAVCVYGELRSAKGEKQRQRLRADLLAYNRADLEATTVVATQLVELEAAGGRLQQVRKITSSPLAMVAPIRVDPQDIVGASTPTVRPLKFARPNPEQT